MNPAKQFCRQAVGWRAGLDILWGTFASAGGASTRIAFTSNRLYEQNAFKFILRENCAAASGGLYRLTPRISAAALSDFKE